MIVAAIADNRIDKEVPHMPYIYEDIYGKEQVTLSDRQQIAGEHPELLLYLMTVSRFDRTGSITGQEPLGHLILAS